MTTLQAESRDFFNFPKRLTPTEWVPDTFPGVKRPGRDTDHLPAASGEVNNEYIWRPTYKLPACRHVVKGNNFCW